MAAIGSFAAAEAVAAETGIAAAATSGILLGNLGLDNREEIERFTQNTTTIVFSFVIISLAALIGVEAIAGLGVGVIAIVAVIMLVLRPLGAFVVTLGVERFTRPERLFIASVGPWGIIPASVATLFAIELELAGSVAAGELLVGTVFAVIFATVLIEAGLARQTPDRTFVAVVSRDGENHVPTADSVLEIGDHVTFIGDADAVRRAMDRFHPHD